MTEPPLTDAGPSPALGESRAEVLKLLREAEEPLGVQQIATTAGLHVNTARFHLDGLVEAGLAERQAEERNQPGRPRVVYQATSEHEPVGQRSYQLLATMLTTMIASELPKPREAATAAGREWGRYLARRPAPFERIDVEEGINRLTAVLADAGFAPGLASDGSAPVLPLHHCPFREVAERHGNVVCALHLGLMQGVLAEVRAPVVARRLDPFVEPSLCLVQLATKES